MKKSFLFATAMVLSLVACGDDETINENTSLDTAESWEDLVKCSKGNAGDMVFVQDSNEVFYCAGGEWQKLSGEAGTDVEVEKDTLVQRDTLSVSDSASSLDTVVVSESDTVMVMNADESLNGKSCTAKAIENGYKILCGGDSVGVVLNGDNGLDATDTLVVRQILQSLNTFIESHVDTLVQIDSLFGMDGESCSVEAIENGYKIECGGDSVGVVLNGKYMCGTTEYDPAEQFCFGVELYDLCGGDAYDVTKYFCHESALVEMCGGNSYNPDEESCKNGAVLGSFVDTRDNQTYKTTTIGTQTWMAQNLNYADSVQTPSLQTRSWCYENSADSCAKYGRLYTWAAAIDSVALANDVDNPLTCGYDTTCTLPDTVQGICPTGWHLPSTEEWKTLVNAVGGADNAGLVLKATSGWSSDGNGLDTYGFSALPAGCFVIGYGFATVNTGLALWTSSEENSKNAYDWYFVFEETSGEEEFVEKFYAQSVRCVKDL